MNDKDKKAFEWWWHREANHSTVRPSSTWQAACDYKQKEIDQLKNRLIKEAKSELERKDKRILELEKECTRLFDPTRKFWDEDYKDRLEKFQAENSKLRECVEFYADLNDEVSMYDSRGVTEARQILKELEEK